jgi:hypothetical protein
MPANKTLVSALVTSVLLLVVSSGAAGDGPTRALPDLSAVHP